MGGLGDNRVGGLGDNRVGARGEPGIGWPQTSTSCTQACAGPRPWVAWTASAPGSARQAMGVECSQLVALGVLKGCCGMRPRAAAFHNAPLYGRLGPHK